MPVFRRSFRKVRPREQHKIICSDCGKEATVPFKPREGRPVYCQECFEKRKEIPSRKPKPKRQTESENETEEIEEF